jgi:hypothetical protein
MRTIIFAAVAATLASPVLAAPVQVRVTGTTNADGVLIHDILQHVTLFGGAFNCPAPSTVQTSVIPAARIPASAEYRSPSDEAFYEEWRADFCGTQRDFFISHWPDPNGGSFLKVSYPYPDGAPHSAN